MRVASLTRGSKLLDPRITFLVITVLAIFEAIFGQVDQTLGVIMEFNRVHVLNGEVWRIVTGHLVHWSWNHLGWDLGAFVCLSLVLMSTCACPRAYVINLALSTTLISLSLSGGVVGFMESKVRTKEVSQRLFRCGTIARSIKFASQHQLSANGL